MDSWCKPNVPWCSLALIKPSHRDRCTDDREWGTELLLRGHEGKRFHFANVVLPHIPLPNFIYLWIAQLLGNIFLPLPMPCHSAFRAVWTSKCRARGNWEDHLKETKQNSMLRHISVPFDALCVSVFNRDPFESHIWYAFCMESIRIFQFHQRWSKCFHILCIFPLVKRDLDVGLRYNYFAPQLGPLLL